MGVIILLFTITLSMQSCREKVAQENTDKVTKSSLQLAESASTSKTLYAESNGRKIAYRTIGSGRPMILCHRFRANMDDWDPAFLDALAKNYQVIIFDHSGMASSTGTPSTTVLGFAQDVKDLADALGFHKIIVGGWSLGGWVAQIVTTEFPELVSHTILIGTKPPGKVEFPNMEEAFLNTAYKPTYSVDDETILFFEPTSAISRAAAIASHDRIAIRTTDRDIPIPQPLWEFYHKCGVDFANDPYGAREKLQTTNIPILVISADHEVCFPPQNWYSLTRKLPTTQFLIIPQAGHGPQHQYPEFVAQCIDNFIKQFN